MTRSPSALAILLLWSVLTQTSQAALFDVSGTPYETAFSYFEEKGVIQGYPDGSGRPYGRISRVEALKVLLEADPTLNAKVRYFQRHMPSMPLFSDTDQRAWYAAYIEAAFAEGMVTGYPDRTFRPSDPVTTEEATALLLRIANRKQATVAAVNNAAWYVPFIEDAKSKNLFSPTEQLYLAEAITRGQFLELFYRLDTLNGKTKASGALGKTPVARPLVYQSASAPNYRPPVTQPRPSTPTPAPRTNPSPAPAPSNSTYFAISLPSIGIENLKILTPSDPFTSKGILAPLQYGVGHLFAVPGQNAKTVIYGHSSGYSWDVSKFTKIFRSINKLNIGDRVYVNYHGTVYTYEVTYKNTIPASDTSFAQGTGEELILYTCWPPDSIKERYLVHAKRVTQ